MSWKAIDALNGMKHVTNHVTDVQHEARTLPSIEVSGVSVQYPSSHDETSFALKDTSFNLFGAKLVVFAGESGSGKSTLAQVLIGLIPRFIKAHVRGNIKLNGQPLQNLHRSRLARLVGYVPQYPADFVTSLLVEEEIAFPLENLGFDPKYMNNRLNHVCNVLEINHLRQKLITELSAGELQRVALATALVVNPPLLILDEPLARIDSASEEKLVELLKKISKEGHLVLAFEHKLDYLLSNADEVFVLKKGRIVHRGSPTDVFKHLKGVDLPEISQVFKPNDDKVILSIEEAAKELIPKLKGKQLYNTNVLGRNEEIFFPSSTEFRTSKQSSLISNNNNNTHSFTSLIIENLEYQYPHATSPTIKDVSLKIREPRIIGLLGANGSGKTTLLKLITGFLRPQRGNVFINGQRISSIKVARSLACFVPENAKLFIAEPTPVNDLTKILKNSQKATEAYEFHDLLKNLKHQKIYHLSEGQRRLIAIFNSFHVNKPLLLFDEPTIGLDVRGRMLFQEMALKAKNNGKTVMVATNDSRLFPFFDELIILYQGQILLQGIPRKILYQLEEVTGLRPNQAIILKKMLEQALDISLPPCITINEMNEFLNRSWRKIP